LITLYVHGDESNPPQIDCIRALNEFKKQGYEIVIFSVRSNLKETSRPTGHNDMLDYLHKYKIPYDSIHFDKVHCSYIIDDRCFGISKIGKNVDWTSILNKI
jgi:hypothetical protein